MMYNWNTTFDTARRQMAHTFENGVGVITDFNFGITSVYMNGEKINAFSTESLDSIEAYTLFLQNTAIQAEAIHESI
jgi:hypothetical protein